MCVGGEGGILKELLPPKVYPKGSKFFLFRVYPFSEGDKLSFDKVVSLEMYWDPQYSSVVTNLDQAEWVL